MAKGKSKTPVVISKSKFLLPKMEWYEVDKATGEGFFVRELSGRSLLEFKEKAEQSKSKTLEESLELLAFLVARGVCGKDGGLLFSDNDVPMLAEKSPVFLKEVSTKVLLLSGIPAGMLSGIDEVAVDLKNAQPSSSTTE